MPLLEDYQRGIIQKSSYIRMSLCAPRYQLGDSYDINLPISGVSNDDTLAIASLMLKSGLIDISIEPFTISWTQPESLPSYSPAQVLDLNVGGQGYLYFALGADNQEKAKSQQLNPSRLYTFYRMSKAEFLAEISRLLSTKTCTATLPPLKISWLNRAEPISTKISETTLATIQAEITAALAKIPIPTNTKISTETTAALASLQEAINSLKPFSLFINCGQEGENPIVVGGNTWIPDKFFDAGHYGDNGVNNTTNTDYPEIYRSERYGTSSYNIPVPPGNYQVSLYFAENYFDHIGDRIFNIQLQKTTILENFDILSEAGGKSKALIKKFSITTTGEEIRIQVNHPGTIMGISISENGATPSSYSEHTHPVSEVEQLAAELNNLVEEINNKQPRGNYATAQGLIDAIALLQTTIEQKQPLGNYAPTNHEQSISTIVDLQRTLTEIMQAIQTRAEQAAVDSALASLQTAISQKQPVGDYPNRLDLANSFAVEATTTATLLNGWTRYSITYGSPGYYKTPLGEVILVGAIKGGTLGVAAITLPEGYRPRANKFFQVFSSSNTGTMTLAYAEVKTDGSVTPMTGNNVCFSLEGIRFRTT